MNFGGYEIVREISRSPLGFSATARGPDGGAEAFHLQVQYFDPIAAPGEERFIVDAFLERARLQQLVEGGHWATICAVGEIDEGAFVVSELFPRTAQTFIDGRTRLAGADVQRVVLGGIEALSELRERAGGRAHGAIRAETVLIDDSAGPGRWRVALCDPSPEVWDEEALRQARLRDARALGAVVIGLVEHRQPRTAPTRIEESDPWRRIGGSSSGAWVEAVNRLLDADLDPDSDWLGRARAGFGSISVERAGRRPAPFVIGGVLALALAGGGAWLAMGGGGGGGEVQEAPLVTELTPAVWQDWVAACLWVPRVRPALESEWSGERREALSAEARAFLDGILAACPKEAELIDTDGDPLKNEWSPHELLEDDAVRNLSDLLIDRGAGEPVASEERRVALLLTATKPETKANAVAVRVQRIREACSEPPALADIKALVETLSAWGAEDSRLEPLTEAEAALTPGEVSSADEIKALVKAVDAGSRAKAVREGIEELGRRVEAIRARVSAAGAQDPVLTRLEEHVRSAVAGALPAEGGDTASYEALTESVASALAELDAVARFLDAGYAGVDPVAFRRVYEAELAALTGLEALERWRVLAQEDRVRRLPSERDAMRDLREPGAAEAFLSDVRRWHQNLDGLPQKTQEAEIGATLASVEGGIDGLSGSIAEALAVPRTLDRETELNTRYEELTAERERLVTLASGVYGRYSKSIADLLVDLDSAPFPGEPALSAALSRTSVELRAEAERARSLTEMEQNLEASRLFERYKAEVGRLRTIRDHTNRSLNLPMTRAIIPAPLLEAFTARRHAIRASLAAGRDAAPESSNAELESLASQIESAVAAAAAVERDLTRWGPVPQEAASVLVPPLPAGADAAFVQAVAPLRARLEAVARVSGEPAMLLAQSVDAAASPEVRRAAFERAGSVNAAWPATAADLRSVLAARASIHEALGRMPDPLWSPAEVDALAGAMWQQSLSNARDEQSLLAMDAMRAEFGLGEDETRNLPDPVRRNLAIGELRGLVAASPKTEDPAADDRVVKAVVEGWLDRHGGIFSSHAGWAGDLRAALTSEATTGADFDAGDFGPGTAGGWSGRAEEDLEVLVYTNAGSEMRFRRVETGDADLAWFLAEHEVSLELYLSVAGGEIDQKDQEYALSGPRGWLYERGSARRSPTWFEHRGGTVDFRSDPLYAPALRAGDAEAELASETDARRDRDKNKLPVQNITLEDAQAFCARVACVLPPAEVWLAAAQASFDQQGLGAVAINGPAVAALGLQVRDAAWAAQAAYYNGLATRNPAHQWWFQGALGWKRSEQRAQFESDVAQVWSGVDDGMLYFAPVTGPTGVRWPHIVGNVYELVRTGGGVAAVGASAMSPPSVAPTEIRVLDRPDDLPLADVGFRPAFTVPAQALNPTVARKVEILLDGPRSPASYPAAGGP